MTLNVSLPIELEARVRAHVASGLYGSASEVIREAGKTSPAEMVIDPEYPSTRVVDWKGAALKQGCVVVGRARTRGPNRQVEQHRFGLS